MRETNGILTRATHVNGWEPAVHMRGMSQNFRLFHVSNLAVRNFRIFMLMYTGSMFRSESRKTAHAWSQLGISESAKSLPHTGGNIIEKLEYRYFISYAFHKKMNLIIHPWEGQTKLLVLTI